MIDIIKNFIEGIISRLNLQCSVEVTENDEEYKVEISGVDTPVLIGYRGDVLDSLQYLTLLLINKEDSHAKRLVIDGENYREKREVTLSKLAKNLAFKVARSGKPLSLEPMNPFERRIIHSALVNDSYVTTESEGTEPNRYVVIKPVKNKKVESRPQKTNSPKPETTEKAPVSQREMLNRFSGKMKSFGGEKRRFF